MHWNDGKRVEQNYPLMAVLAVKYLGIPTTVN